MGSKEKNPRRNLRFRRGFGDWTDEPYSDLRLSPRACLNRQAGFHRGATRGELDSSSCGIVGEANT